jgi:hypothetical protein
VTEEPPIFKLINSFRKYNRERVIYIYIYMDRNLHIEYAFILFGDYDSLSCMLDPLFYYNVMDLWLCNNNI